MILLIDNRADYHHVKLQLNAGVLDSSGLFDISSVESGTVNYGDMTVRNGNYQQTGNVQTNVSNNIALLGGTLNNQDALNIGAKSGNFSVAETEPNNRRVTNGSRLRRGSLFSSDLFRNL